MHVRVVQLLSRAKFGVILSFAEHHEPLQENALFALQKALTCWCEALGCSSADASGWWLLQTDRQPNGRDTRRQDTRRWAGLSGVARDGVPRTAPLGWGKRHQHQDGARSRLNLYPHRGPVAPRAVAKPVCTTPTDEATALQVPTPSKVLNKPHCTKMRQSCFGSSKSNYTNRAPRLTDAVLCRPNWGSAGERSASNSSPKSRHPQPLHRKRRRPAGRTPPPRDTPRPRTRRGSSSRATTARPVAAPSARS